jgi:hypothetical protein
VKKLRRKRIAEVDAANAFLDAEYWADHNQRFAQAPASAEDFHLAVPRRVSLDQVFRLEQKRTVSNDWVVQYDNRLLQLERQSGRPPARSTVLVYETSDGQLEIRYRDRAVHWTEVQPRLQTDAVPPRAVPSRPDRPHVIRLKPRRVCADHPWRHQAVEQYFAGRDLTKARRAWERGQP